MPSSTTIMMALAGGLYAGPFLAGLSRQSGWTVLAFAVLLALWSVFYQRGSWPRTFAALADPVGFARALLLSSVMLGLAAFVFLAGMGLSYIAGVLPLPPAVPILIPVAALGLATAVHPPSRAAEMDAFLDGAIRQLQGLETSFADPRRTANAERLAREIGRMPADADAADILALLRGAGECDAALLSAIDRLGPPAPRPARLAAVLLATNPDPAPAGAGQEDAAWVFDLARGDADLEILFARRALLLLANAPHRWRRMPYSYDVEQARAASALPEAAALLADLRDRLNALSAQEE